MITINKRGIFSIPECECFIGYAGDNLNTTKEIFVEGVTDLSLIYRMYLKFDDGSCNYFLLESEVQQDGTMLVWNVTADQIYKSGIVQLQIKASNTSGEVFHSSITTMLVQTSVEFSDYFKNKDNSEFLMYEARLNELAEKIDTTYTAVTNAVATAEALVEKIESQQPDTAPVSGSDNLITSSAVYDGLATKINYKNASTISSPSAFNNLTDLNCIYDVTITSGVIDGISGVVTGKLINMINYQLLITNEGKFYMRNYHNNGSFYQILN